MTRALYIIADYFGAYINILSLIFLILAGIIIISRYGDIVIGGKDAKTRLFYVILVCDVHLFWDWNRVIILGNW